MTHDVWFYWLRRLSEARTIAEYGSVQAELHWLLEHAPWPPAPQQAPR
jgi:hypothetical protein